MTPQILGTFPTTTISGCPTSAPGIGKTLKAQSTQTEDRRTILYDEELLLQLFACFGGVPLFRGLFKESPNQQSHRRPLS